MTLDATAFHRTVVPLTSVRTRAKSDAAKPGFTGVAVPFNTPITLYPGLREQVAPGAIESHDGQLWWRHKEVIGVINDAADDDDAGWLIDAAISDTTQGRDAATLMRDGAVSKLSIGFDPIEWTETRDDDGTTTITHTRMRVREVSLVPTPAYETATITEVRQQEGHTTMPNPITAADLDAVRADLSDMKRSIAALPTTAAAAATDRRSAGTLLKAAFDGDDTAVATLSVPYQRAYTGGTSADDFGRATWAADLTRIIDAADPLAGVFSAGTLPETGMTLEFGRLKSNTVKVEKQAKEGDQLAKGNVKVETASVSVSTYGGAAELTVQEMKRSQAPLIDMHFRALAVAAGAQRAKAKLEALNALVTAQNDNAIAVAGGADGWKPWVPALTTVAQRFTALGLGLSGLLLPEATWNALGQLADTTGRPMLATTGPGTNNVGTFTATTLDGQLLQVPTRMIPGLSKPVFFNRLALRDYTSPLVRINNDLHALDLTAALGVYQFGAVADEVPTAVIPVTLS